MTESIPFMNPRLVGARFDQHAIPLEVFKDLAALEELVVEVAKWHFLKENSERKRIPRGFADQISLKVNAISEGSAIPQIVLAMVAASGTLFPFGHQQDYFEMARDSIFNAVNAAENNESLVGILTDSHLAYFDRIGRSLRDGESMELNYQDSKRPARLNKHTRRYLTLAATSISQFTEEVSLRGTICEADQRKSRFEVQLVDKSVVRAPIQSEHLEMILLAFEGYQNGARVAIDGIGRFDRRNKLTGLESVEQITLLDKMDVGARLDEFCQLRNGWYNGEGRPYKQEDLDWLTHSFESFFPAELPTPYLYPVPDGGVQAEWSQGDFEMSLEIDVRKKVAYWHRLNTQTDEDSEKDLDLNQIESWEWLAKELKSHLGESA